MTTAFLDNEATTVTTVFMASAAATVILGTALAYVILKSSKSIKKEESIPDASACSISDDDIPELVISEAFPGGYLTVLYGSQTGTAAGFAKQICEESLNRGFKSRLVDMEDITTLDDVTTQSFTFLDLEIVNTNISMPWGNSLTSRCKHLEGRVFWILVWEMTIKI